MKYGFIERHAQEFSVVRMCTALKVSRSGYYAWHGRPVSYRQLEDQVLLTHIWRVHLQSRQAYGAKKTWIELREQGVACGKRRVARLRRHAGIEARRKRRFRLTVENHATAKASSNLVQQHFQVERPNRVWVGDMTYIRTRGGYLYLAVLLDLYARRVGILDRPASPINPAPSLFISLGQ